MAGRRLLENVPILARRSWEDVAPQLQRFLERLWASEGSGLPSGVGTTAPSTVEAGDTAVTGDPTTGWTPMNHVHAVLTGTPSGLADAAAEGTSPRIPRLDHKHKRDVRVKAAGSDVGTRNAINFVDTDSDAFTVTDNPGADRVDVSVMMKPWANFLETTTTPYTVLATDYFLLIDTTGGNKTVNLPAASAQKGRIIWVKKKVVANTVVLHPAGADNIEGAAGDHNINGAQETHGLISDGVSNWWIFTN